MIFVRGVACICCTLDFSVKHHNLSNLSSSDITVLHMAASNKKLEPFKLLLHHEKVTNLNPPDTLGQTPLHYACMGGHVAVVEELLKVEAVDKNFLDTSDMTPLHIACAYGRLEVVKVLLTHEAVKVNPRDYKDMTPIDHALHYDRKDIAEVIEARLNELKLEELSLGATETDSGDLGPSSSDTKNETS